MKTAGALGVVLILLSATALAGPGGGGGGGGGSHGGGGGGSSHSGGSASSGASAHASSTAAAAAGGASHIRTVRPAASGTHVVMSPRMAASSAAQKPKPGFWKRHLHHYAQAVPEPSRPALCTEEEMRLGRCPNRAATRR
jgi:hypothetical protein